ncbi:hypothetical protein E2C01_021359 [Portunus trituberculatus]|uniref:Uncharacterized protein n=1 Tax=Portunus trituberculatus TaxID=210409 RepID=A0A5B7E5V4_PORTR|nr:hypothetical protein [Portunus trituberculatus]
MWAGSVTVPHVVFEGRLNYFLDRAQRRCLNTLDAPSERESLGDFLCSVQTQEKRRLGRTRAAVVGEKEKGRWRRERRSEGQRSSVLTVGPPRRELVASSSSGALRQKPYRGPLKPQ